MSEQAVPKRKILKRIVRWTVSVLLTVIVLLGIAFAYLYSNQEKLRGALVSEVNEYLDTDLKVGSIELDFFSRFPDVSFRFSEVFCKEVYPTTSEDTLFYFQNVYFEFNFWKLIQSEYELKGIAFDEGNVELRIYRTGRDNFHFWKESSDTSNNALDIALEDVHFNNTRIYFYDQGAKVETILRASDLRLKGGLTSGEFASSLSWKGAIQSLSTEEVDYLPNRRIAAQLNFRTTGDSTFIEDGQIELEGLNVHTQGYIAGSTNHWELSGENLPLAQFISMLPKQFLPDKSLVDADGNFALEMQIHIEDKQAFIAADTRVNNGNLDLKKSGLRLSGMSFDAHFDNGERGRLEDAILRIERISARTKTGEISGNLSIRNFSSPTVATNGNLNIDFDEALTLAGTNFWEAANGTLSGSFDIRKRYTSFGDIQADGLQGAYLKGSMNLTDGRLKVKNSGLDMANLSAALTFAGANIEISNLAFESGSSDFKARGTIENALVFGETPMPTFRLSLHSDHLNLEDIFAWELNHREESAPKDEPFRFDFNVALTVDEFEHKTFSANKLAGQFYSQGKDIVGNNLRFAAAGGNVKSNFRWHPEGKNFLLTTNGSLQNVDMTDLFTQFENFGQESLTADNIYGKADVDYAVSIYFNDEMEPVIPSLKSETDFTIRNGRLVNYKPLESLSRFADVSELRDVHFETLENHLSINNENIHIPGMTVKSSVLELWVEGDHSFANIIDYSLKLKLLDALGTRRRTNDELSEFIQESTREQPQIPVRIYGPLDNLTITLDKSLLQQGIRDEWQAEGQELRDLLNGKEDNAEPEPEYIFEWNDTQDTTNRR